VVPEVAVAAVFPEFQAEAASLGSLTQDGMLREFHITGPEPLQESRPELMRVLPLQSGIMSTTGEGALQEGRKDPALEDTFPFLAFWSVE
jgi:hypothetical protein